MNMLETLKKLIEKASGVAEIQLSAPEFANLGHFTTNVAFVVAKRDKVKPADAAEKIRTALISAAPKGLIDHIDIVNGFINLWVTKESLQNELANITMDPQYGCNESLKGKTVMIEFTDPNPFKLFHIGHFMSNTIGESFAKLHEASGAKVIRASYQGDVGAHVAKAIWGMEEKNKMTPLREITGGTLLERMKFLGDCYAFGSAAYEERPEARTEIDEINQRVYSKDDPEINKLYNMGFSWSLEYFARIYKRLGARFDHYFFESDMAKEGLDIVQSSSGVFVESQGAIIFPGEKYGLHTRVFINSKGLPTYETKELALNRKKFELYQMDLSVVITANEQADYFKVLLKVMEIIMPEVAAKTKHVTHGMMRLPGGKKMSSRTGNVITADSLIDQTRDKLEERGAEGDKIENEAVNEAIAIGALRCSILRQSPGKDIAFDFDKSLSLEGDSGPYLQYAYVRALNILKKADKIGKADYKFLDSEEEIALILKLIEFPGVVRTCTDSLSSSGLVTYLFELARTMNRFYETRTC